MKYKISFLLFCLLIENVLTNKVLKKPLAKVAKGIKMDSDMQLKNERKLQNGYSSYGDEDAEDGSGSYVESEGDGSSSYGEGEDYVLPASEPYVDTDATSAENINPLAQDARVGPDKPVSTKGYTTDEKEYNIQIVKFHDFKEFPESGMISFSTIFYFKERIIPFSIIFRLRITYNSDSETADSLRTNCIVEGFAGQEKAGKETSEGEIFNYYCTANVTQDTNNAFIQLNTDPNLILSNKSGEYEIFDFYEVNFIGLTKDEAMNLQDFKEEGYLPTIIRNTIVSINNSDLIFTGEIPTQRRLTSKNQEIEQEQGQIDQVNQITMNLNTKENGNYNIKKYNCTQNIEETSKFEVICDTTNQPINTNIENLHLSTGITKELFDLYLFEIQNWSGNSTDIILGESSDTQNAHNENNDYVEIADEAYIETAANEAETGNATAVTVQVDASKPISTKGYTNDVKDSDVQIMKFHSFTAEENQIKFNSFFYFINRTIPYTAIYRVRITYNSESGLRNLQTVQADSARTDCIITDPSLAGTIPSEGAAVDYSCSATSSQDASNANVAINSDFNLVFGDSQGNVESYDFNDVSFTSTSSDEATNIESSSYSYTGIDTLKNTTVSINNYDLIFTGKLNSANALRRLSLNDGDKIVMDLKTNKDGDISYTEYNCSLNEVSSPTYGLTCNTSSNPINTSVEDLHLSTGTSSDGTLLTIEMKDWSSNSTEVVTEESFGNNDYGSSSDYVEIASEEYTQTAENQAESGNATAVDVQVDASKPVSTNGYTIDEKESSVQIIKFHSYDAPSEEGEITFNSFFYFNGRQIPHRTIFRLRIKYNSNSRLRNLQTIEAYSSRTDCFIVDTSLEGITPKEGEVVDYSCSAYTVQDASNAEVSINTDFDLILAERNGTYESYDFEEVSFTGNSSEEAKDIQSYTDEYNGETDILTNVTATIENYVLKLTGELVSASTLRRLSLSKGDKIEMYLKTNVNGTDQIYKYICTLNEVSSPTYELTCDTSSNPINTSPEKLHLSLGKSNDGTLISLKMKNWNGNETALAPAGNGTGNDTTKNDTSRNDTARNDTRNDTNRMYSYSRSSSGLSGGAIAGIVIACVAVLGATVLAIFLLRRKILPNQPPINYVNNSTEVNIKAGNT